MMILAQTSVGQELDKTLKKHKSLDQRLGGITCVPSLHDHNLT
jgi:hypothetical protein